MCSSDLGDRLLPGAGLAHDIEISADVDPVHVLDDGPRCGKKMPQARPKHALIVGDDNADRPGGAIVRITQLGHRP